MSPLERHCRWLLLAYPAWYRRERSEAMLGTLLEASPPGRGWPTFRDTRALIMGGLRARGWAWLFTMVWLGAGVVNIGYTFYNTTKPFTWADVNSGGLSAYPVAVQDFISIAGWAWLVLTIPVMIGGLIRLGGWRRGNWLRASAWVGTWIAGVALIVQAGIWGEYPEQTCVGGYQQPAHLRPGETWNALVCPIPSPAVVSWGELAIFAAWLVIGALMTWVLAVPPERRPGVPSTSGQASLPVPPFLSSDGRKTRKWPSVTGT